MWHGPIQPGATSTQKPQTRLNNSKIPINTINILVIYHLKLKVLLAEGVSAIHSLPLLLTAGYQQMGQCLGHMSGLALMEPCLGLRLLA